MNRIQKRVLVDNKHSKRQSPNEGLIKNNYHYYGDHGLYRAFSFLASHDYAWFLSANDFTLEYLKTFDVVFINLVHSECPDFDDQEKQALIDYVAWGGSVLFLAEHTNVYRHAERLNPILSSFGIEIEYTAALDTEEHCIMFPGWIQITTLHSHPINNGIKSISFQVGGTIKTKFGVAFLSAEGFGDFWDPTNGESHVGDHLYTDPINEPKGYCPLIAAYENSNSGRVVVVGDQNIYGDVWIQYHDNFKHFINVFEWLSKREVFLRNLDTKGLNICIESIFSQNSAGRTDGSSYYNFFSHLNRDREVNAFVPFDFVSDTEFFCSHHGTVGLEVDSDVNQKKKLDNNNNNNARDYNYPHDRLPQMNPIMPAWEKRHYDVLFLLSPFCDYTTEAIYSVLNGLYNAKTVVILFDLQSITTSCLRLILTLAPDFFDYILSTGGINKCNQSEFQMTNYLQCLEKPSLTVPVEYHSYRNYVGNGGSERFMKNRKTKIQSQSSEKEKEQYDEKDLNCFQDYVFTRFLSTWGAPLISVQEGKIDIARVKRVLNGNLIIFVQNDFWRNKYLGSNESNEPNERAKASINLLYNFLNILKTLNS